MIKDNLIKVLVLCQRKYSDVDDEKSIEKIKKKILNYTENLYPTASYIDIRYLTPGIGIDVELDSDGHVKYADYNFELDSDNTETIDLVNKEKNTYNFIIFQTCGILSMKKAIIPCYSLLKNDGLLSFTSFTSRDNSFVKEIRIISSKKEFHNTFGFLDELNIYFEEYEMLYKKREHIKNLGRKSKKRKSKKRKSKINKKNEK
jgi:hypothetical protein